MQRFGELARWLRPIVGPGLFFLLLVQLLSAFLPAAVVWVGKELVDAVVLAAQSSQSADAALKWLFIELSLVFATQSLAPLQNYQRSKLGGLLAQRLNLEILQHASRLPLIAFEKPETYNLLQNAKREASSRPLGAFMGLMEASSQLITIASLAIVLLSFHPAAILLLLLASLPQAFIQQKYAKKRFELVSFRAAPVRILRYFESLFTRADSIREILIFGWQQTFLDRYASASQKLLDQEVSLGKKQARDTVLVGILSLLALYGCYAWIVLGATTGVLSLGSMTMYLVAFRQSQGGLQGLWGRVSRLKEDLLHMGELNRFLALEVRPEAGREELTSLPASAGIELQKVNFKYPLQEASAIAELDLKVEAGETLAIVGENGAGKSTLAKLICGLHPAQSGKVLLHDLELSQWAHPAQFFSVVWQDFVRYQLTLADSIDPRSEQRDSQGLQKALSQAGFRPPPGVGPQTQLGRMFPGGRELSVGQWQMLAIARAIYRKAPVVVLDEPSSGLDPKTEAAVFERLQELSPKPTIIVISHRFSTVKQADRVALLKQGRLCALGSHESLLQESEDYRSMYQAQAKAYQSG